MTLPELKSLWNAEREDYKRSEVGTGVQRFVWEMLKSQDFFRLKQGLKSTADHKRRGEFLLEERRKNSQADAVIFMDAEVVVPVEVERFENARTGEWQILRYRTTFDKKYGILTDGYEWRFYYGEIADCLYYSFSLDEMLERPSQFRTFWEEYVKPSNYYLALFERVGQQSFTFDNSPRSVDENRNRFFSDVTDIIRKLKDKLLNAGYFRDLIYTSGTGEKERRKKAIEIAYSYLIQFILYKTLVDNEFPTFENDFSKKEVAVHRNLRRESFSQVLAILEGISERISANIYKPFHQEQALIVREIRDLLHSGEDNLLSVAPFLDIFVLIKRYHFGNVRNDIFGAIYENYLKELYDDQLGQHFTDPAVVNFMLSEIGYSSAEITDRGHQNISIVDPSCGSGTFLYSAIREIVNTRTDETEADSHRVEADVLNNVFGFDIAEFPLYLAEMSILMRMLPLIVAETYNNPVDRKLRLYVTEDSLSEFIQDVGREGQVSLAFDWTYHGFMRDEADLSEMRASLDDHLEESTGDRIPRRRFDFVIGNPPYIGYNQASKTVQVKLFRMMKDGIVKMSNVYGWNLHSAPGRRKKYPPKPNLYAFFMALGFALLKEDVRFCYIIPRTMLSEPDYDVVRYHLSHNYTIDSLITFSAKLFVGRSTDQEKEIHTSSLILVCTKRKAEATHAVECVSVLDRDGNVDDVMNRIADRRRRSARQVPQSELRSNIDNWSFITWSATMARLHKQYKRRSESISVYSEHQLSRDRFGARFYFDVGFILERGKERGKPVGDMWGLVNFHDFLNFSNFRPATFYPCSEADIGLPKNSQGHAALYQKYKLLWEKSRAYKFYFTDADVIPSMSHCQIISSNNCEEIMFLFAVLNSSISRYIFEAMFAVENEKVGMFVAVSRLKKFIRPPLVDTPRRLLLKERIIALVDKALDLEKVVLGQFVEMDTLVRHVDNPRVEGHRLLVTHRGRDLAFPMRGNGANLVESALAARLGAGPSIVGGERRISVKELKSLCVFDAAAQEVVLTEVDDLILELYGIAKKDRKELSKWRVR